MTDIINAEVEAEAQENTPLTVAKLIESLSTFPLESELVAGIQGGGLTIPIVGAVVINSAEGVTLTVLQLYEQGVYRAITHAQQSAAAPN